jgi:hypothetical protein
MQKNSERGTLTRAVPETARVRDAPPSPVQRLVVAELS